VEQLSGVAVAVIRDVKMLRQKFRQEVDRVSDQLKEIAKNQTREKEARNRVNGEQLYLELLGSQLKNKKGEHILGRQAGRV
jgi:hypothetical protein